ncbi:Oidioi.mRNA.OKI2018_I69.XSR.g14639.t1.cds [Oikopleura dioica]|uniref:Oidioi.mRNA.OKI2018_I69.XSR.g14639.t1.cds n=1 Tax=Oikopleura dioica TaxID=34765 RepID=A0ABN7SJD1_OIKDI|nr:Oidioi.mRNA.OKI2018_I69.XSR.g14639.t1.cds [Oikopleura dioica]
MSINDIRAGIPLPVVNHISSQLEANPDTGGIRLQAPKTAEEPYPDYGEKASEAARLFGRISDRVFPIGKSYSQGEFEQGEDEYEWDNSSGEEYLSESEDEPANHQNKPFSDPAGGRMARKSDETFEQDWNRRSKRSAKCFASDVTGSFIEDERNQLSDSDDRRNSSSFASRYKQQRNFPKRRKRPIIRHRYGHYGDEDDNRNGPFYYNERTDEFEYGEPRLVGESSRKVATAVKGERQRRTDGFRPVRFRSRRVGKTPSTTGSVTTPTANNATTPDQIITITDDEDEEQQPTKPRKRVVTPFRLPKGSTTAAESSSGSSSEGEPDEGDPLTNIDNFWG